MGAVMSEPVTDKHSVEDESERLILGSSSMQGWRVTMEDADTAVLKMKSRPDVAYFAVFDGHGGDAVAKYAGAHLHGRLESLPSFQSSQFASALRAAFLELDDEIRNHPEHQGEASGCAAVAAIITKDEIIVANAGDSRAVLSSEGKAVPMSFDHKPTLKGENSRIVKANGFVEFGRVNGNLALSRALGDFEFKQREDLPAAQQIITALPDTEERRIDPTDEFLIIACDGIWDCVSSQTAVDYVHCAIAGGKTLVQVCEALMNYCMAPQSQFSGVGCDNMTMMVVGLLHEGETKDQWYARLKSKYTGPPLSERFPKEVPVRPPGGSRERNGASGKTITLGNHRIMLEDGGGRISVPAVEPANGVDDEFMANSSSDESGDEGDRPANDTEPDTEPDSQDMDGKQNKKVKTEAAPREGEQGKDMPNGTHYTTSSTGSGAGDAMPKDSVNSVDAIMTEEEESLSPMLKSRIK